MKDSGKKKTVLLSFDDEMLIDVRKILFARGVTIQQFVTCAFHKLTLLDPNAVALLDETVRFAQEKMSVEDKEEITKIDPRSLYELFERDDFNKE